MYDLGLPHSVREETGSSTPRCLTVAHAMSQITQVDGSEMLRHHFARAMAEIFPIQSLRFFTPGQNATINQIMSCAVKPSPDGPILRWSHSPQRNLAPKGALARCIGERKHVFLANDPRIDYFPVTADHKWIEIVEVNQYQKLIGDRELLHYLLQVYGNFQRILHSKEIDKLTGLFNRGAFDEELYLIARDLRAPPENGADDEERWWLLMVDIDHFKSINDNYGHLMGDEVLLLTSRLIQQCFRGVDRLYRYGGEEFAILLSNCDATEAWRSAERLRRTIANTRFPQIEHLTISGGLAPIDRFDHIANIIGRADSELYRAKNSGRNRICQYASPLPEKKPPDEHPTGSLELFA